MMCDAKPGLRCSPHARKALEEAVARFRADPSDANREAAARAKREYDLTPEGIQRLEELVALARTPEERERRQQRLLAHQEARARRLAQFHAAKRKELGALSQAERKASNDVQSLWAGVLDKPVE